MSGNARVRRPGGHRSQTLLLTKLVGAEAGAVCDAGDVQVRPASAIDATPATIGSRALSHFLDGVIFGLPCFLFLFVVVNAWDFADAAFESPGESYGFLLLGGLGALYEIAFVATTGQTPGRVIAGVRVRSIQGDTPGWAASVTRYVIAPGIVTTYLIRTFIPEPIAGIVSTAFIAAFVVVVLRDPRRRGWHDKAAGTIVVQED
jgi:uncharacterized RDD family membrane protein YckC